MILRAAIVFLLVLNLGVAAWWLGGDSLRPVAPATAVVAIQPGLRLVNEPKLVKPPPAPQSSTTAVVAATVVPVVPTPVATGKPAEPPVAALNAAVCLSFGPFPDAAARDAVRATLQPLAQAVRARESQAKSVRGWRVYMPSLASRQAAQELVETIKMAGIKDWYIIATGEEANSIALGRYGSEESARRRQAELAAKGFQARAESLGDTPQQWWLDARFPATVSRSTLAAIAPSRPQDCARLP